MKGFVFAQYSEVYNIFSSIEKSPYLFVFYTYTTNTELKN